MLSGFPERRLRRLRRSPAVRGMLEEAMPAPGRFIWPVFVRDGKGVKEPIDAMPGQFRFSPDMLVEALQPVLESGIAGILVFPVVAKELKTENGEAAFDGGGIIAKTVELVRGRFPATVVFTDVCLCAYTTHGHCGPLDDHNEVDNDAALEILARTAAVHAAAGATGVAPSAMMDGQVSAIRKALDVASLQDALIMSYSTKFASSFYGPFREAGGSAPSSGDRKGYQASFADPRRALLESALDEAEGADILMVKPALCYLDIISRLRQRTDLPLAAYNVSGEYSMITAAAERGWGDMAGMVKESIMAIARSGADIIISYWAARYRELISEAGHQ